MQWEQALQQAFRTAEFDVAMEFDDDSMHSDALGMLWGRMEEDASGEMMSKDDETPGETMSDELFASSSSSKQLRTHDEPIVLSHVSLYESVRSTNNAATEESEASTLRSASSSSSSSSSSSNSSPTSESAVQAVSKHLEHLAIIDDAAPEADQGRQQTLQDIFVWLMGPNPHPRALKHSTSSQVLSVRAAKNRCLLRLGKGA